MSELKNWLSEVGLEPLARVLADNDVDLDILPDLTEADFEKLGISLGHRRKLIKAIASLHGAPVKAAGRRLTRPSTPPKAAATSEAERRQVTVLFSDLVGSTALATALDPEDMSRPDQALPGCLRRRDRAVRRIYRQIPGRRRARLFRLSAGARRCRRTLGARGARHRRRGSPDRAAGRPARLKPASAIATGLVVVGDIIGSRRRARRIDRRRNPNLAARLQALAEPNTVWSAEHLPPARPHVRI